MRVLIETPLLTDFGLGLTHLVDVVQMIDATELPGHFGSVCDQHQRHFLFLARFTQQIDDLLLMSLATAV